MPVMTKKDAFNEDMAHDYIVAHGFGVPTDEGLKFARMLFEKGDSYADIAFEVTSSNLVADLQED
jgi:hypothetical protein